MVVGAVDGADAGKTACPAEFSWAKGLEDLSNKPSPSETLTPAAVAAMSPPVQEKCYDLWTLRLKIAPGSC